MVWTISREKKSKFFIFFASGPSKNSYQFCVCVDKWLSLQNWFHRVSYTLPILWVCVLLRLIGSSYSAFVFPRLSPCLGFLPLHLSFCFSIIYYNQPLYFFQQFWICINFWVPEGTLCSQTLFLHSHTHITLCSARHLLGSQEMLFLFRR